MFIVKPVKIDWLNQSIVASFWVCIHFDAVWKYRERKEYNITERIEYAIHTKRILIELVAEFSIKFSYLHRIHRKNIYEHDAANMERAWDQRENF